MSEWSTLRVRTARLDAIKARAEAEGTNATAWADRALGAALANGAQGDPATLGGDQGAVVLTTPDPRRAPEVQPIGRMVRRAMELQERAEREARE